MRGHYVTKARMAEIEDQLSERDLAVLKRVCQLRFVSGNQLARMHFEGSARATRRALLRLVRLNGLERLDRRIGGNGSGGSDGFIYRLGLVGQRLATTRGWQPARRRRRGEVPGMLFLRHTLQVAELHALLVEAAQSGAVEIEALASEPACWRQQGMANGQRSQLKPDSYVELGASQYIDSYFIEVDNGTEGSRALDTKLRQYLTYEASGLEQAEHGVFPRTLWLAPDAKRVAAIEACIARLPRPSQALFAVAEFADAMAHLAPKSSARGLTANGTMESGELITREEVK